MALQVAGQGRGPAHHARALAPQLHEAQDGVAQVVVGGQLQRVHAGAAQVVVWKKVVGMMF